MKQKIVKTAVKPFEEYLHGRRMVDNYRWLETDSEERTAWIDQQNNLVNKLVLDDPNRGEFARRFDELFNYDRTTFPVGTLTRLFYAKTESGEDRASLYMRSWPEGKEEILVDINKFSDSGNFNLSGINVTRDGKLVAYRLSENGSDWNTLSVLDVDTGEIVDEIPRLVYTWACWLPDNSGFFYSRSIDSDNLSKNGLCVFKHKLGEDWSLDEMVFGEGLTSEDMANAMMISQCGRHLIITVDHGLSCNELFYADLSKEVVQVRSITAGYAGKYNADIYKNTLYIHSNKSASNFKICRIDLDGKLPVISKWETIIPESDQIILNFYVTGEKIFVSSIHDVISHTFIYSLDGLKLGEIESPGIGDTSLPYGEEEVDALFVSHSSPFQPVEYYRYDIHDNKLVKFSESSLKVNSEDFLTEQLFFRSFDGTVVPMLISRKKNIEFDGSNPVLLTGYGGFAYSLLPFFSPAALFWLEQGGIYAVANLRGGGEYGENWHLDGMLKNKQNVFNDFIAAGEALIGERPVKLAGEEDFKLRKYSSKKHLGVTGGSNGGLLTAAVLVQRPDLWAAVISDVPLLDMLRFHFTEGGKYWISEYGNPDNPEDFEWLLSYSPYHNVKDNSHFPPVLLKTSLHDDRGTDSLHAFKMVAKLQAVNKSDNPILLRTMTNVGHGGGRTTRMNIDEQTEKFLFLVKHLNIKA